MGIWKRGTQKVSIKGAVSGAKGWTKQFVEALETEIRAVPCKEHKDCPYCTANAEEVILKVKTVLKRFL